MEIKNLSYIESSVKLGKNVIIEPFCIIKGETFIDDNSTIESYSTIENSVIGKNSKVSSSVIKDSMIMDNVEIGPYAKIIKNSKLESNVVIGNFVEIKNSKINAFTKIKHHAYVGDSVIGEDCNVGCGVIFANYNGKEKQKIIVGDNVFIGSNSVLIAPLSIEKNCYICAGTNLTKDLKENSFVIARNREIIKENRAINYLKKFKE